MAESTYYSHLCIVEGTVWQWSLRALGGGWGVLFNRGLRHPYHSRLSSEHELVIEEFQIEGRRSLSEQAGHLIEGNSCTIIAATCRRFV